MNEQDFQSIFEEPLSLQNIATSVEVQQTCNDEISTGEIEV